LLSADRVVSFDELTEALWGSAPPSARVAVHVMRLRKAPGDGARIRPRPYGYQIRVDDSELDVSRFDGTTPNSPTSPVNALFHFVLLAESHDGLVDALAGPTPCRYAARCEN
jgi:DNA-binding SARP family transcriptional activator